MPAAACSWPGGASTKLASGGRQPLDECYFPDSLAAWAEPTGHSDTSAVACVAHQANVGQLVLLHIDPHSAGDDPIGFADAQAIFPATHVAEDLDELEF